MPIKISDLESARFRTPKQRMMKSLNEALASQKQTAFLCHSHRDRQLAEGLRVLLSENGWDLYIDWQDHDMPERPNKETADKIRKKISDLDWFLFLATPNSSSSRWCPWEIGIADRSKHHDQILIIPTSDNSGRWHGNEYLQLYDKIDPASDGSLARFGVAQNRGTYLRNLR